MNRALIGYTGFVGSTLLGQTEFNFKYRSTNISDIQGRSFDMVVCAAAPAKKWYANQHPEEDASNIDLLMENLSHIKTDQFILISTVDVFKKPICVNENSLIETENLHPYGFNRFRLECFIKKHFENYLIVRLPGLVGHGLKKNIIFDFLNNNNLESIESRNIFQFYPMDKLWNDINIALANKIRLIHLTAAPLQVADIAQSAFGFEFKNELTNPLVSYDMQSIYSHLWGNEKYQYNKTESMSSIRQYALTEGKTL